MMEVKEFNITVPWGHIAVKAWGKSLHTPVLVVHGLSDNAGSFNRLIPLLPTNFYYMCIELPGHGQSSPYPPYLPIHTMNLLIIYKYILDYLKYKKYIIMGHSWGAQIAVLFTQLFPEYATKLILLDGIYVVPPTLSYYDTKRETLEKNLELMKAGIKPRSKYTYDEALFIIKENRKFSELNDEAAKELLSRCIKDAGDGKYQFTLDPRTSYFHNPDFTVSFIVKFLMEHPLKCPTLLLLSEEHLMLFKFYIPILNAMRVQKTFKFVTVPGNHDVHNNNPEVVAPHIKKFLLDVNCKL